MKKRNNIIIGLALVAIILFAVMEFVVIPKQQQQANNYSLAQQEPVTHDLGTILPYRSKYMGDASNNSNLFHALPMNECLNGFQQNSDLLELTMNYNVNSREIASQKLMKTLIYNSTAAFALIDNLQVLRYHFNDQTYQVTRNEIQSAVAAHPSELLNKQIWKTNLQDKLQDEVYVRDTFQLIAKKEAPGLA